MDIKTFKLLADDSARDIFKYIINKKIVQYRDLVELGIPNVDTSIKELYNRNLIDVNKSTLADFSTYYITKTGLGINRQLNQFLDL